MNLSFTRGLVLDYLARCLVTFVFWVAAAGQLANLELFARIIEDFGLPFPQVTALIVPVTLLAGSIFIILNLWAWLGATILAVFILLTIPIAHPFWTLHGQRQVEEMRIVFEHISVIGGLIAVARLGQLNSTRIL